MYLNPRVTVLIIVTISPNPISKWAEIYKQTYLPFPSTHPMSRFADRRGFIPLVGRYGDTINFQDLSTDLQTEEIATLVGALRPTSAGDSFVACGSYGEVENIADLGYHYNVWNFNATAYQTEYMEWPVPAETDHFTVLENVALKATDQLRQRVAWSLLNIVTIASQDIDFQEYIEGWLSYYDMLVRNAFGNYMDVMRDVSYHPLMGQYLSYYQNKAYSVQNNYPDENYAREIMQLFSIGLWRLNDDGTQKVDQDGVPMETYTNDDIIDFARLWTGFDRQAIRDNFATIFAFGTSSNYVDKMQIRPQWRDRFPKAKLDSGYLGDTYPLCDDMPAQAFLREGARYEFTGSFSVEGDLIDAENTTIGVGLRGRLQPSTTSALYQALCAPASAGGACTFPLTVTLTSNLACTGKECNAQRVIAVKIVDPVAKVTRYYQYVGLPCVRLTLFDNGQLIKRDGSRSQCADPTTRVASPTCCSGTAVASNYTSECLFANEAADFATTQQRCQSMGLSVCSTSQVKLGTTWANACAQYAYAWTNTSCSVQVQVYATGQIGIVDPIGSNWFNILKPSSNNLFRVRWDNAVYPQADNVTCPAGCGFQATPDGAGSCLCNFTINAGPIFGQLSDLNGINADDAINAIAQKAFVGSVKPGLYDEGTYSTCSSSECTRLSNVVVWLHKDDNGGLSEKTIFQLPPVRLGGRDRYLLNKVSTVVVSDSYSFRNPPHFTPLLGELTDVAADYLSDNLWVRKAEYEVESLLEHLFEHDNTAVFVSYRLIQQMVTSNPSPRYVKSVVNAFRNGAVGDVRFSGKYGDLGAAVYAILMDHEARSPIVEADKTYGMLRDPLLKVYHFMRSLGYTSPKGREVALWDMDQVIGVQPFTAPTVFGFYLPEYRPQGRVGDAGLVGPQVQIATTPALVGYLNGITSLIDNGLTSCDGGFALPQTFGPRTCNANGPNPTADGIVSYTPPDGVGVEGIIDELDMILLGGRLNPQTRATFIQEYNNIYTNDTMAPQALRHLLKLFAISSEYQTTNINALTATPRTESNAVKPQGRKFKAIVVIFEYGGCDSYSLLVPHSNCPKKDMYNEYRTVRTDAALDKSVLLPINVPAGTQPCNTFGVHPIMKNVQALYNEGSALFATNIGSLVEPVTKDQVNRRTGRLPPSLFAHNIMQRNVQNVYAQYLAANGVLGRLTDALLENNPPYASALFSLSGNVKMVQGKLPADYLSGSAGVVRVRSLNKIASALGNITEYVSDSVYADTYADTMRTSVGKTEVLGTLLANTNLTTTFGKTGLDLQMSQVAKLIKSMPDATGIERAVFFTSLGGFDTHATFDLSPYLGPVDTAVGNFAAEMKAQGRWDDVVILSVSDFARTLTSNGKGTDHAWGGNHFVAGGSIKGGQILGHYPEILSDDGPQILTRGRVIPTMPFEGMWKGIAEWFGVPADQMEKVLPNVNNFPADVMYSKEQMFKKF